MFLVMDVNVQCLIYVQDKGNSFLLSVGSVQRNLHRLLCEAQRVLTEEVHLHLVVENCEREEETNSLLRVCLSATEPQIQFSFPLSHSTVRR